MKKNTQIIAQNSFTEFMLYTTPNGKVKVEIYLRDENLWLTQKRMAALFGVGVPAINKHLKNIFESGELQEDSVISILEITAEDGKKYSTRFYNLDAIISVGYRVNSTQATHFRIWATQILKEYIIKGFTMDAFLQFNEKEILQDSGKISHEVAVALAEREYEKYRIVQDRMLESDFDREVKKLLTSEKRKL